MRLNSPNQKRPLDAVVTLPPRKVCGMASAETPKEGPTLPRVKKDKKDKMINDFIIEKKLIHQKPLVYEMFLFGI
jgi:hypothetical protein